MSIKILLIEDNLDHIEITKNILEADEGDFELDTAQDAKEGLKMIFERPYDVILCDYHLQDATALDILREINSRGKDTPFIVVTALGSEKVAVDLMKQGAYDYILKDLRTRPPWPKLLIVL